MKHLYSKPYIDFPSTRQVATYLPADKKFYTYQLRLTDREEPFYVGVGSRDRPRTHFSKKQLDNGTAKSGYINRIFNESGQGAITIDILEQFDSDVDAYESEKKLILQWGRLDLRTGVLFNQTEGGDRGPSSLGKKLYKNKKTGKVSYLIPSEVTESEWEPHSPIAGKIGVIELSTGIKKFIHLNEFDEAQHKKTGMLNGRLCYTDGVSTIKLHPNESPPQGFTRGTHSSNGSYYTDGINDVRLQDGATIPDGFYIGRTKTGYTKGQVFITNGMEFKFHPKGEEPPENWWVECPHKNQVYITDGVSKRKMRNGEEIPDGWRIGSPTSGMSGKIWINNGEFHKVINKEETIPDGWERGALPNRPNRQWINNGVNSKMIKKDMPIPDGWTKGVGKCRHNDK